MKVGEGAKPAIRAKALWIRQPYLSQILDGRKTVEVRVGYDNILRLKPGDRLKLNDQYLVTVRRVGLYADFEELLAHEDPVAIAPDQSSDELLGSLRRIYSPEKEALGTVALELTRRRYDAILFDMGYTLVHFEPPQEIIVQEALRVLGAERSADEIMEAVKVVWGEYYRDGASATFPATPEYDREVQEHLEQALLGQLGLARDPETRRTFAESVEAWFSRPGVMRPYPEVVEVLATLREDDYRLGIVSNWSWNLRERVSQVELDSFFDTIWASAYAGCNKPHPDILNQALVQMGVSADRALYIGDSYEHDVVGARNAGVEVALLDRDGAAGDADCPVIRDLWGVFDLLG
jgi:HAD superfamily hydrolase (TIGR01549 family)